MAAGIHPIVALHLSTLMLISSLQLEQFTNHSLSYPLPSRFSTAHYVRRKAATNIGGEYRVVGSPENENRRLDEGK